MFEGFDPPQKGKLFYPAKWTEYDIILSSTALLMLRTFGEHNGKVSFTLRTALIIVVGWWF